MSAGVRWAVEDADEVRAGIRRGQEYVAQEFSLEAIGGQWQRALEPVPSRSADWLRAPYLLRRGEALVSERPVTAD